MVLISSLYLFRDARSWLNKVHDAWLALGLALAGPWPGPGWPLAWLLAGPWPGPWLALGLALGWPLAWPWLALGLALGWPLAWPLAGPWPGPWLARFRLVPVQTSSGSDRFWFRPVPVQTGLVQVIPVRFAAILDEMR